MHKNQLLSQLSDRKLVVQNLGLTPYKTVWRYQQELVSLKKSNRDMRDILLICEHPPVYTLGTGSSLDFVHFDQQDSTYEIHRIERGGEVTHHCPGQIVLYPILDLNYHLRDLHWYLRQLEQVVISALEAWGIAAHRVEGLTGVWVEGYKVAAVGIKVSRWITMHGLALNVCPDMTGFSSITPCGISDRPVGSLSQFDATLTVDQARAQLLAAFVKIFGFSSWSTEMPTTTCL